MEVKGRPYESVGDIVLNCVNIGFIGLKIFTSYIIICPIFSVVKRISLSFNQINSLTYISRGSDIISFLFVKILYISKCKFSDSNIGVFMAK